MIAFGIGCFLFEIPDAVVPSSEKDLPIDKVITGKAYAAKVQKALGKLASVDNIRVNEPNVLMLRYERSPVTPTKRENLKHQPHQGGPIKPLFGYGRIRFDLHIPKRMQTELGRILGAENFRVDIWFTDGLPVTFVETDSLEPVKSPSSAVYIVRHFLEAEFNKRVSEMDGVVFCDLGPSPFHADCFLDRADALEVKFGVDRIRSRGYDTINFKYDGNSYASDEEALEQLKRQLRDQLGEYYTIILHGNENLDRWDDIDNQIKVLIRDYYGSGIRAQLRRVFMAGRRSRRLSLQVLASQSQTMLEATWARRDVSRLVERSTFPVFDEDCAERIRAMSESIPPNVGEFASFFDIAHARAMNLAIALSSSLLGGLVGAAITALLTSGKHS